MNKFKKKTRSKMIAASIAILSSAAVVSTGFAAWVISGGDSKEAGGNITADTVINSIHTVKLDGVNDGNVFFGAPQEMTNSSAWLKNNTQDKKEDLTASFGFTVAGLEGNVSGEKPSELFDSTKFKLEETTTGEDASKKYSTYAVADKNYLVALTLPSFDFLTKTAYDTVAKKDPGIYLVPGDYTAGSNGNYGTQHFTVTIQFGWGGKFDNKNPYDYYNTPAMATSSSARSEALKALDELRNIDASFKLTIATL